MSKKVYAHIILLLISACLILAQVAYTQQFNNWYLLQNAGITFNTTPPSPLYGGMISSGNGCASMSDKNGQLLFYCNGSTVWNKNHQIMPNGIGLLGAAATNNNVIAMPVIGNNNLYYIFTAGAIVLNPSNSTGYCYSIVDMSLNGGLGDVTLKNQLIFSPSAERFTIAANGNGTSAWLVAKDWGDRFYSYPITCAGISSNSVISQTGLSLDSNALNMVSGDIKTSPDTKLIAQSFFKKGYIEIYKFNNNTGVLSDAIRIPVTNAKGIEFSPNSKKLYVSADTGTVKPGYKIVQFDLSIYDSTFISNSANIVGISIDTTISLIRNAGYIQLTPDGKITHPGYQTLKLDVILYPDSTGIACNYQPNYWTVGGTRVLDRFPKGFTNLFIAQPAAIADYTLSPCRSATFTGKTYIKGNNLTFNWDFGDGTTATQTVPSGGDTTYTTITHSFPNTPDSFYITLTVSSDTLCGTGTSGKKIIFPNVPPLIAPTAGFTYTTNCNGSIQFTDTSQANGNGTLTYTWYFGDGDSSAAASPLHQYNNLIDSFTVTQIVQSNITGCTHLADTVVKTMYPLLKPVAGLYYTATCGNLSIQFTDTSQGSIAKRYIWFGDGYIDSTNSNTSFSHTYMAYDTFLVKMLVKTNQGCQSDTLYLTVITKATPVANFVYNNNGCAGIPFILNNSSTVQNVSFNNFEWYVNGALSSTQPNASLTLPQGNYTVKLKVTSAHGCTDSITKNVAVQGTPIVTANFGNGCVNSAINFNANATAANGSITKYIWYFGNGDSALQQNTTYTYSTHGKYEVSCHAVSSNGCTGITKDSIVIESIPHTDFSIAAACTGKESLFTNTTTNALGVVNYYWNFGNGNTSQQTTGKTIYTTIGSYTVSLTATTTNGCTNTTTHNLTIKDLPAFAGNDTTIWKGTSFILHGSGGTNYSWQPSYLLQNANTSTVTGIAQNTQQFILKVTDNNGCIGYDSVWVYVMLPLKIPNAFSPNGDGINDTWVIENVNNYPHLSVEIYNRWGQMIHSQKGKFTPWNGTYNNKPVPIGTYYYLIKIDIGGKQYTYSGGLTILR